MGKLMITQYELRLLALKILPPTYFYEAIGLICKKMYIYKIKISTLKSTYIQVGNNLKE